MLSIEQVLILSAVDHISMKLLQDPDTALENGFCSKFLRETRFEAVKNSNRFYKASMKKRPKVEVIKRNAMIASKLVDII